jgi:mRNA interferase MazF
MMRMKQRPTPRRGEIWLVSLAPTVGHEIKKTRPAVIVTNDLYNRTNWVLLVLPLTSHVVAEVDQVMILPPEGGVTNPCVTLPDQLRAVDRQRLVKRLGRLTQPTMAKINATLKLVLDLD